MNQLSTFLAGAIFMGEFVAALLFLRFWRRTRDRLFAWFSAAFAVLMLERLSLILISATDAHPAVYLARLLAFLLIIGGVIDRNRRSEP